MIFFSVGVVTAFLHYSATADDFEVADEACLVDAVEQVCGPLSFDSTPEMACVETYVDGQLKWVCA